jgi:multiple sugar transport system permease protein
MSTDLQRAPIAESAEVAAEDRTTRPKAPLSGQSGRALHRARLRSPRGARVRLAAGLLVLLGSPNNEMFSMPPKLIGSEVRWSNFADVFAYGPFLTYIGNSFFVAIAGTLVVLIVSTTAGYAFGRLRWKGQGRRVRALPRDPHGPAEVLVIPMFQVMQWLNWVDTYQALIFPFAFTAFGTFLMRGSSSVGSPTSSKRPRASTAAAALVPADHPAAREVRGRGALRVHLPVVLEQLPLAAHRHRRLQRARHAPVGLATFSGLTGTRWDLQMAAAIISMVPTTILVIVLQKHLVKGIAMAGLGGR